MKYLKNLAHAWLAGVVALVLVACGDGGSGDAGVSGQTTNNGSVAVLLTDAPNPQFQEINLTVTKVELLGEERRVALYDNPAGEKINLLSLQTHSELFALNQSVPAGKYEKIRLQVNSVELVRKDTNGNVIETIQPKLPGNGKIDLNPRGEFNVVPGETLTLQIDVDAKKSIHIVQTGNGKYIFRPVIFVDVLNAAFPGKLLRISGTVNQIDFANNNLRLCNLTAAWIAQAPLGGDDNSNHCIDVALATDGAVFNSLGDAVSFATLSLQQKVTVVGFFSGKREHDGDDDDNEHHLSVSDHDEDEHYRQIRAIVIEADGFTRLKGTINSAVANDGSFDLKLASGQGYTDGTILHVTPVVATKLLSSSGVPQDKSLLKLNAEVMVEGVIDLNPEPDQFKPAIIFIDPVATEAQLSGVISNLSASTFTVHDAGGDRCVNAANAAVFEIVAGDKLETTQATVADLMNGQDVDAYGHDGVGGCLEASHVLIKLGDTN